MAVDLDVYRDEADRFLAALDEEHYLHYAGLKPTLELEPIYDRHADLTERSTCRELGEAGPAARELWRFACEGYLGRATQAEDEELARLEAVLVADVDGQAIPYRELRPAIANEPDRERRAALDRTRTALVSTRLEPLLVAARERYAEEVRALGQPSARALYEAFGLRLDELAAACERVLEESESDYVDAFGALCRERLGLGLDDVRRHDLARLWRDPASDDAFPARLMVPALEATLAGMGIDLRAQRNIELDVEDRPTKDPRAFCAVIEVPGRIVLSVRPIGGRDDWRALFHEAGHAEHFGHTAARLPLEARRLGDNAVTEGYAFLLEHLVDDPVWLGRRLDVGRPEELARDFAPLLLFGLRRYCAKLLYELELHDEGADLDRLRDRYVELQLRATRVEPSPADFLLDVDAGFYVASYLRAWGLEAGLHAHLAGEHGSAWFAQRRAGDLLRELWHEGQGMDADTLLRELTGQPVELDAAVERARQRL